MDTATLYHAYLHSLSNAQADTMIQGNRNKRCIDIPVLSHISIQADKKITVHKTSVNRTNCNNKYSHARLHTHKSDRTQAGEKARAKSQTIMYAQTNNSSYKLTH